MGSTVHDVIRALDQPGFLPKDVYYTIGGLYEQQQDAFRDLVTVFVAAVLLIFVLLLFLFESFQAAIAMMLTTLLALVAVFIGLWITHTDLTITAMMGMTMIVGIVTEVTIFFYSEYRNLPRGGITPAQRLILAGKNRMRLQVEFSIGVENAGPAGIPVGAVPIGQNNQPFAGRRVGRRGAGSRRGAIRRGRRLGNFRTATDGEHRQRAECEEPGRTAHGRQSGRVSVWV